MNLDQHALLRQAQESLQRGGLDLGRARFTQALRNFRSPDLVFGEIFALRGLAEVAIAQGRPAEALDHLALDLGAVHQGSGGGVSGHWLSESTRRLRSYFDALDQGEALGAVGQGDGDEEE